MANHIPLGVSGKAGDQPAFPFILDIPNPIDHRQITRQVVTGISMRDYLAAQALSTCSGSWGGDELDTATSVADWCYRVADAMLKARETKPDDSENKNAVISQFHGDHMKPIK